MYSSDGTWHAASLPRGRQLSGGPQAADGSSRRWAPALGGPRAAGGSSRRRAPALRGAPGRGREQQEADARHRAAGRLGGSEGPTPLLGAVFVETLHTVVIAGTLRVQALCQAPDVFASLFIRADLDEGVVEELAGRPPHPGLALQAVGKEVLPFGA